VTRALAATLFSALVLIPAAGTHGIKEGGTFRMAMIGNWFSAVDPALLGLQSDIDVARPACGALMHYPNKPLPGGLRPAPDLAQSHPIVSKDRKTYTFTIRRAARFSTGAPVTARDAVHSLERVFTPGMNSGVVEFIGDVVGAKAMLSGKARSLAGATARGRRLTIKLTRPLSDFPARITSLCVVPGNLPADPEGARAPIPSAAPYHVSEYVPEERIALERNRFYRGSRPHHVDRITIDLAADPSVIDQVVRGELDYVWPSPDLNSRLPNLGQRYGINRSRFFVEPGFYTRMFFLNTSQPLFRDNVKLRQAINFAVDRKALTREVGLHVATATDQHIPQSVPGFRDERIYPLAGPDLRRARALAEGRTRSGKATLYTCDRPDCVAPAQILRRNLKAIGISVTIKRFPTQLFFEVVNRPKEPFDIAWLGWGGYNDPALFIKAIFRGGESANFSRFDEPVYNRLIDRADRLYGLARNRAYGRLDVQLARDAAPAIAYSVLNAWAIVSARTGCVVMNPFLDLSAVCLK
jgi:oligopeptide transport system substrate-binding protein